MIVEDPGGSAQLYIETGSEPKRSLCGTGFPCTRLGVSPINQPIVKGQSSFLLLLVRHLLLLAWHLLLIASCYY